MTDARLRINEYSHLIPKDDHQKAFDRGFGPNPITGAIFMLMATVF